MIAYIRFDESPVPEFTVVDHIPYPQRIELTPYPKAGDPNPIVKLGIVNVIGGTNALGRHVQISTGRFSAFACCVDAGREEGDLPGTESGQTLLDLNFADARDGKDRRQAFRETSKGLGRY
jgi:hypothetical protein